MYRSELLFCQTPGVGRAGGFTDDELGHDSGQVGNIGSSADALQQHAGRCGAHSVKGLADRRQAGVVICSTLYVIKTYDGDVFGNANAVIAEGPDGADGGDVIEGNQRGKCALLRQQTLYHWITE